MNDPAPHKATASPADAPDHPERDGLVARGLVRRFGQAPALNGVSLTVAKGEVVCLLGASGCGKSTLLRLIAGVEPPDAGEVWLAGRCLVGAGRFVEPEARGIGFMFQDFALFPHLSVADNVTFGLKGQPRAAVQARVAEVLSVAGVAHLAQRFPHMLSGGESQRVALARALAPRPALLLMDEPFSNLDQGLRETVRAETLRLLRGLGITTLLVTHDPQEALATADRLVLMRAGQIEAMGTPRQVYHTPPTLYAARFLGPGNVLPGTVRDGHLETPLGRFAAPDLADGQAAVAFFRPQALALCPPGEGVAAQIVAREFLGARERVTLALRGPKPQTIFMDLAPDHGLEAQEVIGLRIAAPAVRVFGGQDA